MKKNLGVFAFLTLMMTSLVSAGPVEGLTLLLGGLGDMVMVIIGFISDVLVDVDGFSTLLFAKLLLIIIIYLAVFTAFKKSKFLGADNKILMVISAAVAILSVRYMPEGFVETILMQYSILGIVLTTFIPLIIIFFFFHQSNIGPLGRRAGWVFYIVISLGFWYMAAPLAEADYIYLLGLLAAILALIFDKRVHKYFGLSDIRNYSKRLDTRRRMELKKYLNDLKSMHQDKEVKDEIKKVEKELGETFNEGEGI